MCKEGVFTLNSMSAISWSFNLFYNKLEIASSLWTGDPIGVKKFVLLL